MGVNRRQFLFNEIIRADPTKNTEDIFNGDIEETYWNMVNAGVIPTSSAGLASSFTPIIGKGLMNWRSARANRANAAANIILLGDSIGEGQGATAKASRFQDIVQSQLRSKYPVSGVAGGASYLPIWVGGGVGPSTYTAPLTLAGGSNLQTRYGLGKKALQLSGNTVTFNNITATSIKIAYTVDTGTGTFSYQIDAGTVVNINTAGTKIGTAYTTVTGLGGTSHTVTIKDVSGYVELQGIHVFNGDETAGISVLDSCHGGYSVSDYLTVPSGGTASDWLVPFNTFQPQCVVIELGTNDCLNVSSATFKTNLQQLITNIKGVTTVSPSFVLLPMYERWSNLIEPWANYVAVQKQVAAADPNNVSICDLSYMPKIQGDVLGLFDADNIHPKNKGHAFIAEGLVNHLSL